MTYMRVMVMDGGATLIQGRVQGSTCCQEVERGWTRVTAGGTWKAVFLLQVPPYPFSASGLPGGEQLSSAGPFYRALPP